MPEKHRVLLSGAVKKQLAALPEDVFGRMKPIILGLSDNPWPRGCKKLVGGKSKYRVRVGDYRVLYEVVEREKLVRVYKVGHRGQAYR